MKKLVAIILFLATMLSLIGGFLIVSNTGYNLGIALLLLGIVFIAFILWFIGVFGKTSIFRPHTPRPTLKN